MRASVTFLLVICLITSLFSCTKEIDGLTPDHPNVRNYVSVPAEIFSDIIDMKDEDGNPYKLEVIVTELPDSSVHTKTPFNTIKGYRAPDNVIIAGEYSLPVKGVRGRDLAIYFDFIADQTVWKLQTKTIMRYLGHVEEWPIFDFQLIDGLLPIGAGARIETVDVWPILSIYPKLRYEMDIYLDGTIWYSPTNKYYRQPLVAFNISIQIVDA